MAALAEEAAGNTAEVYPFRLPHDLWDNFAAAGWRRPEVYLDPDVRAGMSAFALAKPRAVEEGVGRLRRDLAVLLYAAGVPLIRSLVWNVATIGIGLIVAALLFG